jgi:O-antigen ligase
VPAAACALLVAAASRARYPEPERATTDILLAAALAAALLQLVPLPWRALDIISPAARPVWQRVSLRVPPWLPLSIEPWSTAWAALVGAMVLATFVAARRLLHSHGIRMFVRGLSGVALVVSAVGLAQDATGHGLMYWRRAPLQAGAPPFGPFVDRNAFATWVLLAIPLCAGYLIAHTTVHHRRATGGRWTTRLRDALDARAIWLAAAVGLMVIALAATLSRSGMASFALVLGLGAYLYRRRGRRDGGPAAWVALICAAVIALAVARIDPLVVGRRFAAVRTSAADRLVIWRETIPVVRDFWLTGTGAGTYETAMLVYQRSSPGVRFNQAHNHYLQVAAEGGLLMSVPVALALIAFARAALRKLREDASGMYWVRAGAFCGLAGVAAQSVWDTGLTAPANAVLAAIAAAIVLHHEVRAVARP